MGDKSLYCVECERLAREVTELRAQVERMRPVVEAALTTVSEKGWDTEAAAMQLCPAVDAYRDADDE